MPFLIYCPVHTIGEVTEWLKVHAWNACEREFREFESHPLRHLAYVFSVIAGSCATKTREPRQVREEATVVRNFVCRRGAWLSFFRPSGRNIGAAQGYLLCGIYTL